MATTKQKQAARRNLKKARKARRDQRTKRPRGSSPKTTSRRPGLSTADQNRLPTSDFAFPDERKEPLPDARHVRNAIARFDQVEGVTDAERDRAWKHIRKSAKKFGVHVTARDWRELFVGGTADQPRRSEKKKARRTR
jgi:Family of unknown function (DUF6582)